MADDFYDKPTALQEPPVAISHIVRTLRIYFPVIALSMGAIMVGYLILAVTVAVLAPAQAVSSLRFRLDFKGADIGQYPNGTKFSSSEIITPPVLLDAFNANDLGRFTTFPDFTKSIFVLESNTAHEQLSLEYQARLSDPKLSPVDRDRLQREYESKLASLSKDQYSINYMRPSRIRSVPDVVARKALQDILNEWAEFVAREQHVLEYRIALLSPNAVSAVPTIEGSDPIIATQMLRANVMRVQANIFNLRRIPASEMVRTKKGELSLLDEAVHLEDILRFRIDPLVENIAAGGLLTNRAATIHFLETQLAYDQRQLEAQKQRAETAREALTVYAFGRGLGSPFAATATMPNGGDAPPTAPRNETVMPQLSDSFIERVIQMSTNTADITYRKALTEEYREASLTIVPFQQAVAYDEAVLDVVRRATTGGSTSRQDVDKQLAATREEVRQIVLNVHEIHAAISRNMNPTTQLLTVIGVPATRIERSIGFRKLVVYGVLLLIIALPIIVVLCLLHNRIREEEEAEASVASTSDPAENTA